MNLKYRHFIVLTFVVQQLLLLDDLSLEAFFSLYTTTHRIKAQESSDVVTTFNYTHPFLSAQLCSSWRSVKCWLCLE